MTALFLMADGTRQLEAGNAALEATRSRSRPKRDKERVNERISVISTRAANCPMSQWALPERVAAFRGVVVLHAGPEEVPLCAAWINLLEEYAQTEGAGVASVVDWLQEVTANLVGRFAAIDLCDAARAARARFLSLGGDAADKSVARAMATYCGE